MGSTALGLAGAVMTAQGVMGVAAADSLFVRDRNVSVLERERPEYAAAGIRAGQFIVKPKLELGLGYTSNAFAVSDVPASFGLDRFEDESDVFVLVRPSVHAESLWSRHGISGGAYAEIYNNREFDTETVTNAGVYLNGQLDVSRTKALFGGVSYDLLHETRRVNNQSFLFEEPIEYTRAKAYLGGRMEQGRMRYRGRIDLASYDFDDVELVTFENFDVIANPDQDFRDRDVTELLGQVGFSVNPDVNVFFRGTYNFQDYDRDTDNQGRNRDSEGWTLAAGTEFDISRLSRGEVALGYFEQTYEDDAFDRLNGLMVDAKVQWFPTELTTVSLTGTRRTDESAAFLAGGYVTTEAILRVDHELRRNALLYAFVGAGREDYDGNLVGPDGQILTDAEGDPIDQTVERWGGGLGGTYYFNRNVSANLGYTYESQDVERTLLEGGFDADYGIHQVLLTVTLQR
jgi:hypothetical protein